ncbi:uncharacterized protein LOC144124132 [Amblyomma americanum]
MQPSEKIADKEAAAPSTSESTGSGGPAQGLPVTTKGRPETPRKRRSLSRPASRAHSAVSNVVTSPDHATAPVHDVAPAPAPEISSGKSLDPPTHRAGGSRRSSYKRNSSKGSRSRAGHPGAAVNHPLPAHTTASTRVSPSEATSKSATAEGMLSSSTPLSPCSPLSPMSSGQKQPPPDYGERYQLSKPAEAPDAEAGALASVSTCPSTANTSRATTLAALKAEPQNRVLAVVASPISTQEESSKITDDVSPAGQVLSPPVVTDSPTVSCGGDSVSCMPRA